MSFNESMSDDSDSDSDYDMYDDQNIIVEINDLFDCENMEQSANGIGTEELMKYFNVLTDSNNTLKSLCGGENCMD